MGIIKWNKEFQGEQTFLEPELSKYEIEKSWQKSDLWTRQEIT